MNRINLCFCLLSIINLCALTSCNKALPEIEDEYFKYAIETHKDQRQEAYIIGLTELGMEQKNLVIPRHINNIEITRFGYTYNPTGMIAGRVERVGSFESEKLRKLYAPYGNAYDDYMSVKNKENFYLVIWSTIGTWKNTIIGYNSYSLNNFVLYKSDNVKLANISYMYNYENADNDGYYWVDSYDNSTIEFIPPEPTRTGYTFDGWYKEPECINEWNFEEDKVGEEITIIKKNQFEKYPGIYLYAKWIKK